MARFANAGPYPALDSLHLFDNYSCGRIKIETVGTCTRLTFYCGKETPDGIVAVPVVAVILPSTKVAPIAAVLSADALLMQDDMGEARGRA